ncbi:MAG: nitrate reductase cytochrome c-type subunit [Gammaproteobacteria bacterium]|nr:nitrate reductase cytochrome c-type subunit [Gammaproteobacteria bacterium]
MKLSAIVTLVLFAGMSGLASADLTSLRGSESIPATAPAPPEFDYKKDKENIPRNFEQQPPLVPHLSEKYTVNLKENKCLECHMKQPGKDKAKSVEMSESHFIDRNGNKLDKPSAGRHFCTQCHVPQVDAEPLIGSNFQSVPFMAK